MRHVIVIAVLSVLLSSCTEDVRQGGAEDYRTIKVSKSDCILQTEYAASISGRQFVEVRPQVSGTITDILIDEGAEVRKGQVLFVIDQVPYRAALETAAAKVRTAEAKLNTARLTAESKTRLHEENVVSEYDLQTALNAMAEAEASLAEAKAQKVNAENDLSYTEVKSPVDGVAGMIPYRVGALVNSSVSEPLVTVSDDSEVYVYFSMSENQILDVIQEYGSTAAARESLPEVSLEMSNGKVYGHKGRIDAISGNVDQSTGSVSLRAVFPNPDGLLRNGGSGKLILPSELDDCIIIPQAATYEIQNKVFVYKVIDGVTSSAGIEVFRLNNGTDYVVTSGLEEGDVIIAEGAGLLKSGIKVNVSENQQL